MCIDPYSPKLAGYISLLSVDGMITDANTSYTVKLSKTFQEQNSIPLLVSDATLFIADDAENNNYLINRGNGIYKTDSTQFRGVPGRTYVLHIVTNDGKEYESEPCLMQSVPEIDSIYFEKDQQLTNNGTQTQDGVSIYLDSKEGENNSYFRWDFDETWEFKIPDPKKWDYIDSVTFVPTAHVREYCWKSRKSDEVLTGSVYPGSSAGIVKKPIFFIATDKSDRLLLQYSILVNQYSISKKEYDFWNNLKQINEIGGDIFAKQPYAVISNIKNITNPQERVLGYFRVSAIKQKRKNILFSDIVGMNLPIYHYPCERLVKDRSDVPKPFLAPPATWDELYSMFCVTSDYYFVEPMYSAGTFELQKMVFARPECANCELTGTITKPDFRIEIN
jgi:hypothetical protein